MSAEGLWILTLPTQNVFLGQGNVGFSSCPCANTYAFGNRRRRAKRRENMDTDFKIGSGFKGEKAEEDDFSSFLSSPEFQMWRRSLLWCWREAELFVVMQIPASLFSTACPAFGEVQQFQHCLWDFSEGTSYQLVIQPVLLVLFWKNHSIFKEVRGHHWLGLTFNTCIFYQEIGKRHSVLLNLEMVESSFFHEEF